MAAAATARLGDRSFEWLCVLCMGFSCFFVFIGADTQSFVVESALHSVNLEHPDRIDAYAGYRGQAVTYALFTVANLVAPLCIAKIGTKWTLFVGCCCMTLYQLSFMYIHYWLYYPACIVIGVGYALHFTAQGSYLAEHSSKATLERNISVAWMLSSVSMAAGGVVLWAVTAIESPSQQRSSSSLSGNSSSTSNGSPSSSSKDGTRQDFPLHAILPLFATFAICSLVANGITALTPAKPRRPATRVAALERTERDKDASYWHQLKSVILLAADRRMALFTLYFVYAGVITNWWLSVYPTTLNFVAVLSHHPQLVTYYAFAMGAGQMIATVLVGFLSQRIENFGRTPALLLVAVCQLGIVILSFLSTPEWSTVRPTDERSLLIQPNLFIPPLLGFLIGAGDNLMHTVRCTACATLWPKRADDAFSLSNFYQSLAQCLLFFVSDQLSAYAYLALLAVLLVLATTLVARAFAATTAAERKVRGRRMTNISVIGRHRVMVGDKDGEDALAFGKVGGDHSSTAAAAAVGPALTTSSTTSSLSLSSGITAQHAVVEQL